MPSVIPVKALIVIGLLTFCLSLTRGLAAENGPLPPAALRCEYLANPLGVDVKLPRFYWIPRHPGRGQAQTAYQLLVSTNPGCEKGDVWDSGKVASAAF